MHFIMVRSTKLFILVLLISLPAFAQTTPLRRDPEPARYSAAEKEVLATDDERFAARARGDVATMSRIYADDYKLITAEGDLRSKADQINEMTSRQLKFSPPKILERTVRVYGHSAVVLTHEQPSIIRNGVEIGGDFRMTRVYVKRGGRWQLVHTQATRIATAGNR